jgi:hypothetical protein
LASLRVVRDLPSHLLWAGTRGAIVLLQSVENWRDSSVLPRGLPLFVVFPARDNKAVIHRLVRWSMRVVDGWSLPWVAHENLHHETLRRFMPASMAPG